MSDNESEPTEATIREELLQATLEDLTRRARIAPAAELGENTRKTRQKVARLQRLEAKATFQEKVAIGNVAEAVGLTAIPLSGLQLRGGLLSIVESAKDPGKLAAFEAVGKAWLDSRRPARDPEKMLVFVTAATMGAELVQACADLRLRRVLLPKGFRGRIALLQALELGRRYSATVRVEHKGEEQQLVDRGVVDAVLLSKLTAEPGGDGPIAQISNEREDNVGDVDDTLLSLAASEAPAVAGNANDEDVAPAEAEAATDRNHEPKRSLHRPLSR